MTADELLDRVIEYGADEDGIIDRFGDNAQLYDMCFREFLTEPSFAALAEAMEKQDYGKAFQAAHALKGISGNLGVTALYNAVCVLVESLRVGGGESSQAEYAEVVRLRVELERLASDSLPEQNADPEPPVETIPKKPEEPEKGAKHDKFAPFAIGVIIIVGLLVSVMFFMINRNYRDNIVKESGQHLIETSEQIRLYIEEKVANDWRTARSVGDSITDSNYRNDDDAIFDMLQRKREVWGVTDLMLYTENGYCIYADGSTEKNDLASDTMARAWKNGKYMSVIASRVIYTVPIDTELSYNGSRIAAVSVVRDMDSFLDNMRFYSFNGKAWMYLTEESGVVISRLTSEYSVPVFNFEAITEGMDIEPLEDGYTADDMLKASQTAAFLMSDSKSEVYVVSAQVETGDMPLRLFYLAPEGAVNDTMSGFSHRLTLYSMGMLFLFALLALLTLYFVYRSRKRLFDKAIMAREHMFDLLIKNTRTAFGLFNVNNDQPVYVSSNAPKVVGDRYWVLRKTETGYRMRGSGDVDSPVLDRVNEMMRDWDGKSVFKSGYIHNDLATPPYFFELQLYPTSENGTDFVGIAQDVTQAYQREEATRNAMEMATRSNEAKSRFLSNMSHDIRTPMNAIMNMTNFALESIDQPKKLGMYLHTIRESSEHLLQLINDVLDMSRIESGRMVVASEPFDISAEMRRYADMLKPLCAGKKQTLITDFSGLRTSVVRGDALKLSQIVINLLSNAVKFTPEKGAVRFSVKEIPSLRSDLVDIRIVVEDNGIGISEENIDRIFEPFSRAADKKIANIEGTGLGLSICRSYVEAMGGTIRCESEEGEGSTFTVELFFQRAEAELPESVGADRLGNVPFLGLRCLVAEDNVTNQLIAKSLLERLGFITDFADDGSECVDKFLKAKPKTYDIIFMDIQMPVTDGCQAAIMIRAAHHPQSKTIPIVAMTANVFAEDIERARIAGMDAYVSKPIVSFDLIEQTNKALNKKRE